MEACLSGLVWTLSRKWTQTLRTLQGYKCILAYLVALKCNCWTATIKHFSLSLLTKGFDVELQEGNIWYFLERTLTSLSSQAASGCSGGCITSDSSESEKRERSQRFANTKRRISKHGSDTWETTRQDMQSNFEYLLIHLTEISFDISRPLF